MKKKKEENTQLILALRLNPPKKKPLKNQQPKNKPDVKQN